MHATTLISAFSALFVLGNAVPLNNGKRDLVWVTEYETAVETVGVTTTVWVDPTPTAKAHANNHRHKHSSSSQAAVEVKPTPSPASSSSSEEAPVEQSSSYEAPAPYVAPTTTSSPEPATTAQAEQTTSTPEAATTQAAVTPESSYVAPVSSYEAPSSTYVAPVSSYEAPSSTYEAPAASSSAPASYDSGSSGSSGSNPAAGKSFTGEMTYFTPGMGACGHDSGENDNMVAISMALFDQYTPNGNPNKNPLCGQTVSITGADGSSHEATIWDRCVGCAEDDLDMPQAFFNTVTSKDGKPADGRAYGMSWSMN